MSIDADILEKLPPQAYEAVRREVRNGDLLLCSADDPMSRAIRWATKSPWSHVALAFQVAEIDRIVVLECVETLGVRAVPLSDFIRRTSNGVEPYPGRILLARHEALNNLSGPAPFQQMARFAFERLGDRFSSTEILKIAMRIALGRFQVRTPRHLHPKDEFICSEYVARCFQAVGVSIPWDGLGFISPGDIAADPCIHPIAQINTRPPQL